MNIIEPKFEIIEQSFDGDLLSDMFKHIELCGRTCYKSEDKITDDSMFKFIEHLEKSEHGAMLEHGTVYLTIPVLSPNDEACPYILKTDIVNFFQHNEYSKVNKETVTSCFTIFYITTNWRVIFENKDELMCKNIFENYHIQKEDLETCFLQFMTVPSEHHEKRYTVKFTCDIGVSREFNRHRKDSIAEESTRYCNYTKDKFGGELNIAKPVWIDQKEIDAFQNFGLDIFEYCYQIYNKKDQDEFSDIDYWLFANLADEYSYINLIRLGWTPQQARVVLSLDTKTELIHTAFASDWKHFFNLRALGTTGAPHPSAKELALPLMGEFIKRGYLK